MDILERNVAYVSTAINTIILPYHNSIEWSDLTNKGNNCYRPEEETEKELANEAILQAAVKIVLPKRSKNYKKLAIGIKSDLKQTRAPSYDFVTKAIAILLNNDEGLSRLEELAKVTVARRGLNQLLTYERLY